MLTFLNDELHHSRASLESAVRVWCRQHREEYQRARLQGQDFTLFDSTYQDLSTAWHIYKGVTPSGRRAQQIKWSFGRGSGLEDTLAAHESLLREARLDECAEHIKSCPRCIKDLLVLCDGKLGGRRFDCAGCDGLLEFPALDGVRFHNGCRNLTPPGHMYCQP